METEVTENAQLTALKKRIPIQFFREAGGDCDYYTDFLTALLEDSKGIALGTLYPYADYSSIDLPSKYNNWQLRACVELFNLGDKAGIMAYGENGISWTKSSDVLSRSLMEELVPAVGVPQSTNA